MFANNMYCLVPRGGVVVQAGMTTPTGKLETPTRIFQRIDLNIEIETAVLLKKFKQDQEANGKAAETVEGRIRAVVRQRPQKAL